MQRSFMLFMSYSEIAKIAYIFSNVHCVGLYAYIFFPNVHYVGLYAYIFPQCALYRIIVIRGVVAAKPWKGKNKQY